MPARSSAASCRRCRRWSRGEGAREANLGARPSTARPEGRACRIATGQGQCQSDNPSLAPDAAMSDNTSTSVQLDLLAGVLALRAELITADDFRAALTAHPCQLLMETLLRQGRLAFEMI